MSKINVQDLPLLKELNAEQANAVYGGATATNGAVEASLSIPIILAAAKFLTPGGFSFSMPSWTAPEQTDYDPSGGDGGNSSSSDYI